MQKEAYFETAPPSGAFNSSLVTSCTFLSPGIPSKGRKGSKMKLCSERNFISGREFVQAWYGALSSNNLQCFVTNQNARMPEIITKLCLYSLYTAVCTSR